MRMWLVIALTGCTYGLRAQAGAEVGPGGAVGIVARAGFLFGLDEAPTLTDDVGASQEGGVGRLSLEHLYVPEYLARSKGWVWRAGGGVVVRSPGALVAPGGHVGVGRVFADDVECIDATKCEHVQRTLKDFGVELGADWSPDGGGHISLEAVFELLRQRSN